MSSQHSFISHKIKNLYIFYDLISSFYDLISTI